MSVMIEGQTITLAGRCGVEEAEDLLTALIEKPEAVVLLKAERIHTALWQVLMSRRPRIEGQPTDSFVVRYVLPLIGLGASEQATPAQDR